jgi:ribosomal protein S18 acetylase RimI-like enzyme
MIVSYKDEDTKDVISLWNEVATGIGYKELDENTFAEIFSHNPYFNPKQALLLKNDGVLAGFACGCMGNELPLGNISGYITCVLLKEPYESTENYQLLLTKLEESFSKAGKTQSELLFFNPMMLPWYIKGTNHHEHNNAPGVFKDSRLYQELLGFGYVERATENAMYLNLSEFSIPGLIREKEEKAGLSGYEVALFDHDRHRNVAAMLTKLQNPLWEKEILQATKDEIPVLIAAMDGEVVGFAGPILRQKSGRGYFTGIGVVPEHEGHGLGNLLFYKLCEEEKRAGAEYMSLYTGSENPAGRIYQQAGFHTVQQFAIMRKML